MAERLIKSIINEHCDDGKVRLAKVYYEVGNAEYRVAFYIDTVPQVDADYYTDNKEDALATGRIMCRLRD